MRIAVEHLLPGMAVDLAGDPFADTSHNDFDYELQPVAFALRETTDCVLVGFDGWDWCGFPPGHKVSVKQFDRDEYDDAKDGVAQFVADFGVAP